MEKNKGVGKWRIIGWTVLALLFVFMAFTYLSISCADDSLSTYEVLDLKDLDRSSLREHDSILIVTSRLYQGDNLKKLMQGEQYRDAWSTPVKMPIVWLDTLLGGLTIIDEGGGMQTHSLKLRSASGVLYTLRSINKDPSPLIPTFAYTLGLENIVIDGISAQHPYASLVVAQLASSSGILHTHPRAMFIPKQAVLGHHNEKYGNRLFMLEFETESEINWTEYKDVKVITETDGLQKLKLQYDGGLRLDEGATVRARLFDVLIGDWDRHAKQWGWVIRKTINNDYLATPLPGDRDNAFFSADGVIPTIISSKIITPGLQSFQEDVKYLPGLIMDFDVYFLKSIPESTWKAEAETLQKLLTDEVIDKALRIWPPKLYDLHAEQIRANLTSRRDDLMKYAISFKKNLDDMPFLTAPLKGSEDLSLDEKLLACFDCPQNLLGKEN